jgi:hypothetical protein
MDEEIERQLAAIRVVIADVIRQANADREWLTNRFDFVEGQLFATSTALRAVIRSTPDAAQKASAAMEQLAATTLHSKSSDEFLRGVETAKKSLELMPR